MLTVITTIVVIGLVVVIAARSKAHERETGIAAPSPDVWANIRNDARDRGIPEPQAYSEWLAREQRKRGRRVG